MNGVLTALLAVVIAAGAAIVLVEAVHLVLTRLGRRSELLADLARTAHRPFRVAVVMYAVQQVVRTGAGDFAGRAAVLHFLVLAVIAAVAWLVAALALVFEDVALARYRTDVPDNLKARRLKTQVVMLRRVTVAAVVVLTIGVMLMTFPGVRALGASVLASAGILSVVAALAAQSTLGNLFAGLQLAFSDSLRVDDVVVVENEWGRIEELTLTYVAVQIWDDRRLILPTSYFTTKPFQHWTRTGSAVLGTAEIDVDWSVPVDDLRAELRRVCEGTELWNGRVCVLQVTEAIGGTVRLRALVSADDAGKLWDLRCLVRERLVGWVWENRRGALPRLRADTDPPRPDVPAPAAAPAGAGPDAQKGDAQVFAGRGDGDSRGAAFHGPDEQVPAPQR
ncbi:mechanosensitive ion channel family protein [Jidongwangia harbinensis]|uniref:mechanosensitive ion channel family protein n=1 Tax=Jidongwangia harbinensis TaxID=2878561 RepID=UPI001CD9B611|nr:mechanosensitive ion channel domain-containing protein [Jidongwangia harbinensis]MCA2214744.1 mechanosensitive ion channel family protein [Jidongwangia harbinensis]